jgi:LemA protein
VPIIAGMEIALIAIVVVIIVAGIWLAVTYNGLNHKYRRVDQSWSNLDVALQNRWETIPTLVDTVKGAAAFQSETLQQVVDARAAAMKATTTDERAEAENGLTGALGRLFALAEQYPNLTAVDAYRDLQAQIENIQRSIVEARRLYNSNVTEFNIYRTSFPTIVVAGRFPQFGMRELFEIDDDDMRAMPTVEF